MYNKHSLTLVRLYVSTILHSLYNLRIYTYNIIPVTDFVIEDNRDFRDFIFSIIKSYKHNKSSMPRLF